MFDDLRDLYQEVILERSRHPRHARRLDVFDADAKGDNPLCGDKVHLWLKRDADGKVENVGFEARGCAISIASADLMADAVRGLSDAQARALFGQFRDLAKTGTTDGESEALDALKPLSGVHEFPSRVKCATLPWHALVAALDGRSEGAHD